MPRHNIFFLFLVLLLGLFTASQVSIRDRVLIHAVHSVAENALEPVEEQELIEGALDGMLMRSPYYPYSAYLPPDEEEVYEDEIQGVFTGIGIGHMAVDALSGELWFTPFFDSPAWKAGLRFGERITAVNGEKIDGKSVEEVHNLLQGGNDETVRLTVRGCGSVLSRYGGESGSGEAVREVGVTRGTVQIDMVSGYRRGEDGEWIYTLDGHPEIGYVRLDQFADETVPLFEKALGKLESQSISSLILDLRGNPGGFLEGAVSVCSFFLPEGAEIVTIRKRGGAFQRCLTAESGKKYDWKLAVLVDEDSASASEIVAGALADHHRAVLVGVRSYGKGTVQELYELPQGMGMIRLTCASFNRPSGRGIHRMADASEEDEWGVSPEKENTVKLDEYQLTAAVLLADLRSLPPVPAAQTGPMTRLIFDRAQKRDLFENEEGMPAIDETACDFTSPENVDAQLQKCIEVLSSRKE